MTICLGETYGRYDDYSPNNKKIIPRVIKEVDRCQRTGATLSMPCSLVPRYQFTYNVDVGRAMLRLIRGFPGTGNFVISSPESESSSLHDVVEEVCQGLRYDGEWANDPTLPPIVTTPMPRTMSCTRFMELFPDFTFTPIREGIQESCAWYRANSNEMA